MATIEIKNERQSESICRLCLTKGEHHQLIFTGDCSALSEWIENLTTLKITEIPNAPASLCLECEITLQNIESFREMCLTNDLVYKDMFINDYSKNGHMTTSNETLQVDEVKVVSDEYQETDILNTGISQEYDSEIKMEYPDIETEVATTLNSQENISDEIMERHDTETTQKLKKKKARPKLTNKTKSHICRFCGKAFKTNSHLTIHIRTHTKEKPFKCKECDRSFATHGCVNRHQLTHSGERPFACDKCPARYTQASYLKWHTNKYHAEGYTKKGREKQFLYVCSHCDKEFASYVELKLHKRTHTRERPYKCTSCDKAFSTNYGVQRHRATHSKIKPFTCDICQVSFALKQGLQQHQRVHRVRKTQTRSTAIATENKSSHDADDTKNFQRLLNSASEISYR